ncbi:MAG: ATP synthase F1 subunit delta [Chloroflexota bacterium]
MAKTAYARRYAQAVFEIALEAKGLEVWQKDLERIVALVSDPAVRAALENPKFAFEGKSLLLAEKLPGITPLALNLVGLLILKDHLEITGDIAAGYRQLLYRHRGILQAEVVTAAPLDTDQQEKLGKTLAKVTGSKVEMQLRTDPSVLGGFVARIDGRLLDGSTRSSLQALKKELIGAGG